MKYMLLIHQGTTPLPGSEAWDGLSKEEQGAVYGAYQEINETSGVESGVRMQPPETATTVRVQDGQTLTTDGPSSRPRRRLAATCSSRRTISTPRSSWRRRFPPPGWAADRGSPGGGELTERVFREEWGRVLATLIGLLGDFDLAEEAAQEAFATAAERWPREGTPSNPAAWLIATGRNRAIDRIRRERTLADKTKLLEAPRAVEDELERDRFPR